ncbi:dihydrodipicolinate synthase family protein [Pigmentiphaga sp.]|uniref:dihydrodipicolinate synthase family protein n=1 Tax=Pigmentiphaga sp. TaxID=1977564 RepID=UPI00128E7521|nr:dihydrodipicolinate synthase family protein [Pigmentiphaga sp.]MPS25377.1 dihydrodipicolinate synthase family protein [Alcaligenaceae bacterium SAGV5]MPS53991.1 dihydrodipicolinate synthase family protein [Alcaligenaceae bacterium SAGV3]MPT59316.1 dihydrodipicolinate synthase family protein [Alcaligenaceae bacterium]
MTSTKIFAPADITGILPPLLTPLDDNEDIVESVLRQEVRYMLSKGVHGLVPGGSAGEGNTLSTDELRRIVGVTCDEADGSVPVVAGIIVNSTRQAIEKAKAVADLGVSALQITPVHYIYKNDDDAMIRHYRTIYDAVGIPIIIYNVIPWNYLSVDLMVRMMREVPGVFGVKQSASDLKSMADLILRCEPHQRIYAAIDALLYPTFALDAHGAISQILSAVPGPCVELWNLVKAGDHKRALELHTRLLRMWNAISGDNRLAVTKYTMSLQGVPVGNPRAPLTPASAAQRRAAEQALAELLGTEAVLQTA